MEPLFFLPYLELVTVIGVMCVYSVLFFYEHLQAHMYIHMYHMYSRIPQRHMCGCGISVAIVMVIMKSCNSVSQQLSHQCIMDTLHANILDINKNIQTKLIYLGAFPCGSDIKESASNAGNPGLIPGSGRFPGEGNDNPLQYSCLENSMDRGDLWAKVHGVTKSQTQLNDYHSLTQSGSKIFVPLTLIPLEV